MLDSRSFHSYSEAQNTHGHKASSKRFSLIDWSDILGGNSEECVALAREISAQWETLLKDSIFWSLLSTRT